jgi:uncharacterized YigZ family protein
VLQDFYTYQTLAKRAEAEFKDRGSRFIAYAFEVASVEAFKQELKLIKELHEKAAHHCFAYRIGNDKLVYRVADDGEPSGSAGRPILGIIDSAELCYTAIVVVRYFGGTLLGVPGLINAYKTAAQMAVQEAGILIKEETNMYTLEFDYTIQSAVQKALHFLQAEIVSTENLLFCKVHARIKKRDFALANKTLDEIYSLQYTLN